MDYFYLAIVVILFGLAFSDLIVGVGNDAVNFLNSAIGAKTASVRVIMAVAIAGVLIGATFSGGMMEIARKGMFYPDKFLFSEIMVIFLAVMFTDVILLDFFNTVGLPTSTTVSIVFELLGSAVAVTLFKLLGSGADLSSISLYINSSKALGIISGILLSVVIAFFFGSVIQFIVRMLFTFDWQKTYRYFAAVWGGISISGITYFLLIKGAKGATFITPEVAGFLNNNTLAIIIGSFVLWTILLQFLSILFKVNILKIIVLFGTFALAMAFAGNDLVNFIGVPIAGYEAYKALIAQAGAAPDSLLMGALNQSMRTPAVFLVCAGIIMSLTLCFSRKARSVIKTSVDLSRQNDGNERFGSNALSRSIVRSWINVSGAFREIIPLRFQAIINRRFDSPSPENSKDIDEKDRPAFDMVRASVNLVVASALIALGTSLTLPLSTTYVTFMVAMGSSLSDRAWGRESAVYRVSGVITVIGGWFFTAFLAFSMAFIIAAFLYYGKFFAVAAMIVISIFIISRTYAFHSKKEKKEQREATELEEATKSSQIIKCNNKTASFFKKIPVFLNRAIFFLIHEKRHKLKKSISEFKEFSKEIKEMRAKSPFVIRNFEEDYASAHYYIQVLDYLKEISDATNHIYSDIWSYIDNNHPQINNEQFKDLKMLRSEVVDYFGKLHKILKKKEYDKLSTADKSADDILDKIDKITMRQIKMVKKSQISPRNSLMITNLLHELKNIVNFSMKLCKVLAKFNLASGS